MLDNGRKAAFEEIVLVVLQDDSHLGINMRLKEPVVLREDLRRLVFGFPSISS